MFFCGLNKTTLLDYPGIVACTVFLGGCNFRCPYCHNMELVTHPADYVSCTEEDIFDHLKKRAGILKGVCITGGEPSLNPDLPEFIRKVKALGYLVKLDTNGTNPVMLRELYEEGLIDYVAMDIKAGPSGYAAAAGLTGGGENDEKQGAHDSELLEGVRQSVGFLMNEAGREGFDYEFRTTVVREFFDETTAGEIADWIKGARHYYLQCYKTPEGIEDPGFSAYTQKELSAFADLIRERIPSVALRGI